MYNILFLTKYDQTGSSSRYRIYKYLRYYEEHDIKYTVKSLFNYRYFTIKNRFILFFYVIFRFTLRLSYLFKSPRYDLIYIEYELFPYLPVRIEALLKYLKCPYVLDYDDAIFHNYDGHPNKQICFLLENKHPKIIKRASYVITGSPYLTQYVSQFNSNVKEIPTSIDLNNYSFGDLILDDKSFNIGWIGSKSTSKYIIDILPALIRFYEKHKCRILLCGFQWRNQSEIPDFIEIVQWSPSLEKGFLKSLDVGLMPLADTPFARGKCGFKLIQYMACYTPTISTPLEANVKIDHHNGNLFAWSQEDWFNCLEKIYLNREYFRKVGLKNRTTVEQCYSVQRNTILYLEVFDKVLKSKYVRN